MEIITNLKFYIKYKAKINKISKVIKPVDLSLTYPDRDNTIIPVKMKEINAYLLNKVPDDEYSKQAAKLVKLIKALNCLLKCSKNNKYLITSDNDCIELYNKLYRSNFGFPVSQNVLDLEPFFGSISRIGDNYTIDSSHMLKYTYKKGYMIPAIKASFKDGKLEKIIHQNKEYHDENNIAIKLMHNYLLIDTVINKHLIVTHLKIGEIFAFAIRKYLSSDNPVKHFLWNFCLGVSVTNQNLIPVLLNKILDFFPFTESGLKSYINDSIKSDYTRMLFPDQEIKSDLTDDCGKIYKIFKITVDKLLAGISNNAIKEVRTMAATIRNFVPEYQNTQIVDMIASFMYVSSVIHYTSNHMLFDYVIKGNTWPVAIDDKQQVHKYDFLNGFETLLESMIPMRKLIYIMPNMNEYAKERYETMIHELIDCDCKVIDILLLESGVQI